MIRDFEKEKRADVLAERLSAFVRDYPSHPMAELFELLVLVHWIAKGAADDTRNAAMSSALRNDGRY